MDVPEGIYLESLRQTSDRIATFEEPGFENVSVNGPEAADLEDTQALELTTVYLLPGQPQPRLRKARFRNPGDVPERAIDGMVDHFTAASRAETSSLGSDEMRSTAEMMTEATDEVADATSILLPFKVIALSAIYNTRGNVIYKYNFAASDLLDALVKRFSVPDEPDDEVLRNMHTRESEFAEHPEPFDSWQKHVREVVVGDDDEKSRAAVLSAVQLLLLPAEDTDPIISRRLFEEAAA